MTNAINWFEIPVTNFARAKTFYETILGEPITEIPHPQMKYGMLSADMEKGVGGGIVQGDGYKPSADGVTIYLNGGDNLQVILDKVEKNGGKILVPKTPHADESGYFALFLDSEGNKMGLHSQH